MADGDAEPGDKTSQARGGDDVLVKKVFADSFVQLQQKEGEDDGGSGGKGKQRHAATAAGARKYRPGEAIFAHGVEHAHRGVHAGVTGGKYRAQDDGVHHGSGKGKAGALKNEGKGRFGDVFRTGTDVRAQQFFTGVRYEQADDEDGEDVEDEDAPEDLLDRFRDAFFRVFRFAGGHADEFCPLEGETGDEEDAEDGEEMPARAVAKEGAVARGEVAEADVLAAHDAEDGERADAEEDDDGDDFNQRKPVFGFAVGAHGKGIERADDATKKVRLQPQAGMSARNGSQ